MSDETTSVDSTTESTAVESTSSTETPQVDTSAPGTEGQAPVPPAYAPNYKYNALGKEHEFDDFVRKSVTTAEQEKRLREVYEKAHGMDSIKTRFNETRGNLQSTRQELGGIKDHLKELGSFIGQKDYGSMLKFFKIPENDMLEWAMQYAQRQQMPPEERQMYDARDAATQQVRELQKQNEYLMDQQRVSIANTRQYELDSAMKDPNITGFSQNFDARAGQAGAFQMEVARRGALHYQVTGQDLPPSEAVRQTLLSLGYTGENGGQQQGTQQTSAQAQAPVGQRNPTLPNISGKSSSPTKRAPKSLDEMRKMANAMNR